MHEISSERMPIQNTSQSMYPLPSELWKYTFTYLDPSSKHTASLVCAKWKGFVLQLVKNDLTKRIDQIASFLQYYGLPADYTRYLDKISHAQQPHQISHTLKEIQSELTQQFNSLDRIKLAEMNAASTMEERPTIFNKLLNASLTANIDRFLYHSEEIKKAGFFNHLSWLELMNTVDRLVKKNKPFAAAEIAKHIPQFQLKVLFVIKCIIHARRQNFQEGANKLIHYLSSCISGKTTDLLELIQAVRENTQYKDPTERDEMVAILQNELNSAPSENKESESISLQS